MLAQFVFDCLTVIENQGYLSRARIRHALSTSCPLGTTTAAIDGWCDSVCDVLNCLPLLNYVDGVFYYIRANNAGTNVAERKDLN
jgi:hypothetical protein